MTMTLAKERRVSRAGAPWPAAQARSGGTARSVFITGASSGIGRACALELDQRGWRVFATVRSEEDAEKLTRDASERLSTVLLDVTSRAQIDAAV